MGSVTGFLVGNDAAPVKLPGGRLHISKPFTAGNSTVNFVCDITVHKAGKSGKYILKPQIAESGPGQGFVEAGPKARGRPDGAGRPDTEDPEGEGPEEGAQVEIEGEVESCGNDTVTVNGTTVVIDGDTEIDGTLAVGAEAQIIAAVTADGLLALEIRVEPGD